MYLPIGLFGVSIAAASTPAFSRFAAAGDTEHMRRTIASAIGLMLVLNVPATLGLMVLAQPIVALIFEHGRFTAADTAATARALQFYAIGLVAYSVVRIVSPAFYAMRLSRIPVMASIVSVVTNVTLNYMLVRTMGYSGLALGTSAAALVNAGLQAALLRKHIGGLEGRRLAVTMAGISVAAAAMALAAWSTHWVLGRAWPGDAITLQALRVTTAITVGLAVLAGAAALLGIREFDEARRLVVGRIRRSTG
jgi:putative peptidoglycan lipid II flippase